MQWIQERYGLRKLQRLVPEERRGQAALGPGVCSFPSFSLPAPKVCFFLYHDAVLAQLQVFVLKTVFSYRDF